MQSETAPDGAVDTTKTAFRKPSNEAGNRKYRRRSPLNGSSSSDGSLQRDRSSSPIHSRGKSGKETEYHKRRKELDRDSGHSQYSNSRGGDSCRHSDQQPSRGSHGYSKHDESVRHEKHANEDDRYNQKPSSRSGRDSRGGANYEYTRPGSDYSRSKDYVSGSDRSIRDKYDVAVRSKDSESSYMDRQKYKDKDPSAGRDGSGRRHTYLNSEENHKDWHKQDRDGRDEVGDYRRSSEDYRSERTHVYGESRGHRNDSSSRRDSHRLKEAYKNDTKEVDGQMSAKEERKKYDQGANRDKDKYHRASGEHLKDKVDVTSETQEAPAKRSRFSNWDKGAEYAKDVDKLPASGIQIQEASANVMYANDSETADDLNAAKVAAMKAAELVNKNLVGGGYMSTDQKKKLLWGNKKSTATEESGRRWESTLFDDRDRQEKFNKLMSLSLPWYIWPIVGCEGRGEVGEQAQQCKWGSRKAESATAGSGEAVHCRTSSKRWPHSWVRPLSWSQLRRVLIVSKIFSDIAPAYCLRICISVVLYQHFVRKLIFWFRANMFLDHEKGFILHDVEIRPLSSHRVLDKHIFVFSC